MRGLSLFLGLMKRRNVINITPGVAPTMRFNDLNNSMNVAVISAMLA